MEAPLGGGEGGEGGVIGRGCRGSHAGRWWSRSTSCADAAPGAGWLISPSILTQGPRGRTFCVPHFTGRGQTRAVTAGHRAGWPAAPASTWPGWPLPWAVTERCFRPSHHPGARSWPSSSFPAWELSLWRGLMSAESRGVEPNGLGPGPALSGCQGWGLRGWMVRPTPSSCLLQRERSILSTVQGLRKPKRERFLLRFLSWGAWISLAMAPMGRGP